jgi:hypothetical protein
MVGKMEITSDMKFLSTLMGQHFEILKMNAKKKKEFR